jgi:branched-chain amino acid transport system substrate-binding protein
MRSSRDTVFIATLVLALVTSTVVALIASATAAPRSVTLNGANGPFTSAGDGTPIAGGTPGAGGNGGGAGGSGGGSSGNRTAGVSGDTIKVGAIFSESNGIDAKVEEYTVRACFNDINAQGGVNGHKLQLVSYDDGLNATTAGEEAVRLVNQDQVFAVVGWLAPFGEAQAAPYFEQHGVPIIGGLGVPQEFDNQYSFPVSPIFYDDGYLLGDYATRSGSPLGFHQIGIILTQTAGINQVANGVIAAAQRNGAHVNSNDVKFVSFTPSVGDFTSIMLSFKSDGVDGIISQIDPFSYVRMYQAMQSSVQFRHLAGAGIDKQSVDQAIGNQLVGTYSFMPYLEGQGNPFGNAAVARYNNVVQSYIQHADPRYSTALDAFSEGSWVSCQLFIKALQKVGSSISANSLVNALLGQQYSMGGMSPTLDYQDHATHHNGANCATYIVYASNDTWQPGPGLGPGGFNCHASE